MNDERKIIEMIKNESLSEELVASIDIFKRSRAILNQTYTALGRTREYIITDTTASYPLKIIPNEQSTTNKIQIGSRLA